MKGCDIQASGAVDLYFYDELGESERAALERHLDTCDECERALEELSTIRAALATRPQVDAPAGGDWRAFMIRLDEAIRLENRAREAARVIPFAPSPKKRRVWRAAEYAAVAAMLTLVISAVAYWARPGGGRAPSTDTREASRAPAAAPPAASPASAPAIEERGVDAAFASLSEQHFERSKLVVLGLANKDARRANQADWAYERELASSLLTDTRLYRMAAEERGMKTLADVMEDLELVLIQTSQTEAPDSGALEQIQRLIQKRDLVTKMDVATTGS